MPITKAVIFTPIESAETASPRPVSEEVIRKLAQNSNMLSELAKIGSYIMVNTAVPGVPAVNSNIFQIATGGEILNGTSPLRSDLITQRYTKNLENKYLRGAPNTTSNPDGGSPTVNLSHTHAIGVAGGGPVVGEEGDDRQADAPHFHGLSNDLNAAEPLDTKHMKVSHYLKIN